jgi:hypothetical protein
LGANIATTVDSEVARYYLESYRQATTRNRPLDDKITAVHRRYNDSLPSREDLASISREFSVDFASLFFASRLLSDGCNKEINQSFAQYLDNQKAFDVDTSAYLVLFVPGWDYAETGHVTGADFAKPRKLLTAFGIESYLVKLPPTGSVERNAEVLAADIARRAPSGKRIVIAGASSAGPAIHLALGDLVGKNELSSIKGWFNLGGLLQGSPLIDYVESAPQRWLFNLIAWFKGWSRESILSMGTIPSRSRFHRLQIDADIFVVNYLGIPLSGQISRHSEDKYPLLKAHGPNDGLTLLTDAIAPNSLTIVALGSDHFFAEDPRIDEKTIALMRVMLSYLEKSANQAFPPTHPRCARVFPRSRRSLGAAERRRSAAD